MTRPPILIPDELQHAPQPFLFREWYCRSRVRRWMEYDRRAEFVLGLVRPGPGRRILDVGCDWGYACLRLAQQGADAWGIDIDADSVEFGRKLAQANGVPANLQYASARELPFPDRRFDAVVSIETLEHVPREDRLPVFREMSRVLRPGGALALSTPNPAGLPELAKRLLGRSRFLRRRFYGSYHDEERVKVFPAGDRMVDLLLSGREVRNYAAAAGLEFIREFRIVFVTKFLPERLLAPAKPVERLLERMPLVRRLGSTSVYLLRHA